MRLVPIFLEQVYKMRHEPSSSHLLFSLISEGSGETALKCSLARSFAARIFDMLYELDLKTWPEPSSKSLFKGIAARICD